MFIKLFEVSRQIDPNLEFKFKFKILELSIAYDAYFEYDPYTVHCALNTNTQFEIKQFRIDNHLAINWK